VKITKTITIDGKDAAEFEKIKQHLEAYKTADWKITYDALLNRATAILQVEVEEL
jgi:hypothetical protein